MSFFLSGTFWFIEGVLAVLVVIGLKTWAEDKGVPMSYWKWILFVVWVLFFGFTLAFIGTSLGEGEPHAAVIGGIVFGLISIISGVGLWRLVLTGKKTGTLDNI